MILTKNPWALPGEFSKFSAQRSDLWRISLRDVVRLISEANGVTPNEEYLGLAAKAASLDAADDYAVAVTLPEETIAGIKAIRGTGPITQPGYDEPRGPVRIQFRHDTARNSDGGSEIYCLLACWQALAQAGQFTSGRLNLPLTSEASRPEFKADIKLDFLTGSDDGETLEVAASYVMQDTWCADVQLSAVSAESGIMLVTATLFVDSLVPNVPTSLSTSWLPNVA